MPPQWITLKTACGTRQKKVNKTLKWFWCCIFWNLCVLQPAVIYGWFN